MEELERGRAAYAARRWREAEETLSAADTAQPLTPGDLEVLATASYMLGRDEEYLATLERAHRGHLAAGAARAAARAAFWIGMALLMRGDVGRGGGWLGRAHQLLEGEGACVERGYMLLPEIFRRQAAGDPDGAIATAGRAADAGRACADPDLFALAAHTQGQLLIARGAVEDGLRRLDEALVTVTSGEVSPIPAGIVYCGAIEGCRTAFDPGRAQEWTRALHAWCEPQADLLAFTGACHVHRAEIMRLHGAWDDALAELTRAARRAAGAGNFRVPALAAYHRGEILRLRGDLAGASEAYREAARGGHEPQPGMALLRLAQGDAGAAVAAIRRVLEETEDSVRRASLLPAYVEIALAAHDVDTARAACAELEEIAAQRPSDMLAAMAAHARGAVELAAGDPRGALPSLRRALMGWHELRAPYEAALTRLLVADACAALGDADSATLERDAAQQALGALGARPERNARGLTAREVQVLRLVAAGATNKSIAAELVLSERTIDRHVSNILAKLRVSSRAAATAYAYQHRLL